LHHPTQPAPHVIPTPRSKASYLSTSCFFLGETLSFSQ
jgi:hypothetical protein